MKMPILERIKTKSIQSGDCLVFVGFVDRDGYGKIYYDREKWYVHRLVYILTHGPTDLDILHSCDNPPCWNIEHLREGTQADNAQDRETHNRGNHGLGMLSRNHKLTEEQVMAIRAEYKPHLIKQQYLAIKYGVSAPTISNIVNRKYWQV
jgi:hypothetical protein